MTTTRRTTTPRTHTRRTHRVRNFFRGLAVGAIIGLLAVGLIAFALADVTARGAHHGWFGDGGNPSSTPAPVVVNCPNGTNAPARECFGGRREHRQHKASASKPVVRKPAVRQPAPAPVQRGLTADDVVKIIKASRETEPPVVQYTVPPPPPAPVMEPEPAPKPEPIVVPCGTVAKGKKAPCQKEHWYSRCKKVR